VAAALSSTHAAPRAASAWLSDVTRVAAMIGRVVHKVDFERVLAMPPKLRSAHFVIHHVASGPSAPVFKRRKTDESELSTVDAPLGASSVDKSPVGHWLGCVIPKRHARRSVTRNLLRRQIRTAMTSHVAHLSSGIWLVRLRAPFARDKFPSASSDALRSAAHEELALLFTRAVA
jgi:ribonuclease P protein component